MLLIVCSLPLVAMLTGCDAKIEQFASNTLYSLTLAESRSASMDAAQTDTSAVLQQAFGTPNDPKWPSDMLSESARSLIDVDRLHRAAGPISSLQDGSHLGLYREHCVHCHGLSGDGFGPTSLALNPYPRDFRHGIFKWKSTRRNAKPTRQDLRRTLVHGEAGTAMPSFSVLPDDELDALVDYVIYLSIRGEVERELLAAAVELGYDETPPEAELQIRLPLAGDAPPASDSQATSEGAEATAEIIQEVINEWVAAEDAVVEVPAATTVSSTSDADAIERGRELFHGQIANCVGCHGPQGNGEAVTLDYDDWTKEYSTRLGLTPTDRDAMKPFRRAGAPKPRPIVPRRLQGGVFRGGGDGETLYRRITQGVAGTPMPSLEVTETESGKGLTSDQVWDLVHYVQSLGKP
ncbi:cytochrome c class I [Rhodopirellula maiorica SM1]|uniref:Cytochrome c class I n=1 Tax=Rhodopirellula maiorica SM1 TaxID=1265738 RepID=M5RRH5_9BACT|nr:cytochrome c class I [Rhodopirellula maiorica SM1]